MRAGVTIQKRREQPLAAVSEARLAESNSAKPSRKTGATRPRKAQTRSSEVAESLQRAALDLFAQQNYSTVTIKDIAAATGINSALIYYYFGSKEELFLKAVENTVDLAFAKFNAVSAGVQSPEQIIVSWVEIHVIQFLLLRKLAKISLDYASTRSRTPRVDRAIRSFYDKESVVLGKAIEDGIAQKLFKPVNPEAMSVFISTFLDGCLFRSVMFPRFNHRRAIDDMRDFVLTHLKVG